MKKYLGKKSKSTTGTVPKVCFRSALNFVQIDLTTFVLRFCSIYQAFECDLRLNPTESLARGKSNDTQCDAELNTLIFSYINNDLFDQFAKWQ